MYRYLYCFSSSIHAIFRSLFFSNGSGTAYAKGASYTANAGTTLYAQWRQNITLAVGNYVTYNPPAGTYTATNTGVSSQTQTYTPSATTKWKVFSVSASGVEIIPENGAGTLTFRGENADVKSSLENIVSNFINSTYADSARHLGLPREAYVETGTWPYTTTTYEMNASDRAIINANPGLNSSETMTFVGGTKVVWGRTWTTDYEEVMASDGTTSFEATYAFSDDDDDWWNVTGSIRPIVKLKSTVFVTGGSGTSASPYTLGI